MAKRKLNYRFHNPNPQDVLERQLLRICVDANMKKVEEAVRSEQVFRVIAVNKNAEIATLKEFTLFKMPKGEFEGRSYQIENGYIKRRSEEIVMELPIDTEITLFGEGQQEKERLNLDEFVKAVVGKNGCDYEEIYRLPSTIYKEMQRNTFRRTTTQSVK